MNSEYKNQYLTFEVLAPGTISWRCTVNNSTYYRTIQYRVQNTNTSSWTSWTGINSSYTGALLKTGTTAYGTTFPVGWKVQVRMSSNKAYGNDQSDPEYFYNSFGGSAETKVYGNILSLKLGEGVTSLTEESLTSLNVAHQFTGLFLNYTNLMDVKDLWLSVDELSPYCYARMFEGCTNIEQAPELLTENLTYQGCCEKMFYNCSSLNFIKCTAKYFGQFACNSWAHGVDTGGHFVTADDIGFRTSGSDSTQNDYDGWIMNENGIPKTWTISTLSEYEGGGTDPGDQGNQGNQGDQGNQGNQGTVPADGKYQKYYIRTEIEHEWEQPSTSKKKHIFTKTNSNSEKRVFISNPNTQNEAIIKSMYTGSNVKEKLGKAFDISKKYPFYIDSPEQSRKSYFKEVYDTQLNIKGRDSQYSYNFSNKFDKFFTSNSFRNPNKDNNVFSYMRANWINKEPYFTNNK